MQPKVRIFKFTTLTSFILLLFTNLANAEDIQLAKSDEIKTTSDDFEKIQYKEESVLEDGRLFVQFNIASYHPSADSDDDLNEFNPGLGLEYHYDNFFISGGFFENSIDNLSTYLGVGHERNVASDWFGIGIIGGVVTGYDDSNKSSPRLAAVPYIYLQNKRATLKIHYLPAVGDIDEDAFGFALRFDLGGLL